MYMEIIKQKLKLPVYRRHRGIAAQRALSRFDTVASGQQ